MFFKIVLSLVLTVLASKSHANDLHLKICSIRIQYDKVQYSPDGSKPIYVTPFYSPIQSMKDSAHSCYLHAINICKEKPANITYKVDLEMSGYPNYTTHLIHSPVYCIWSYDDGTFDDSDGIVTQFSDRESNYILGDKRVYFFTDEKPEKEYQQR